MTTSSGEHELEWQRGRRLTWLAVSVVAIVLVVVAAVLLSSNNDGSHSGTSVLTAACQKVAAALSDGPDPTVDPVGYAEAQVRPLRAIVSSNTPLERAIHALSSAYKESFQDDADKSALGTVKFALREVESFCPGVAS